MVESQSQHPYITVRDFHQRPDWWRASADTEAAATTLTYYALLSNNFLILR